MKQLLDHLNKENLVQKYFDSIQEEIEEQRRDARHVEREKKRLMMGSQYNSSDEEAISGVEVEITETESESYYDTESDFNKVIN
jgi:hypothetical protein